MRLTRLMDALREMTSELKARDPVAESPPQPNGTAECTADSPPSSDEFSELLDAIGAIDSDHGPDAQLALRDATIAELRNMLQNLRGIGDQLAWTEQERLRLVARVAELEQAFAFESDVRIARLEKEIARRKELVARERKRHSATRAKLAERERVAAERWREILELRKAQKQQRKSGE